MSYIKWFRDVKKEDFNLVGGKGANLGELFNSRFPVPQGFCITIEAYKKFLEENDIKEEINRILEKADYKSHISLKNVSNQIKELIIDARFPEDLKEETLEAYEDLNVDEDILKAASKDALEIIKTGREPAFVAVRSSAISEDREEASFAGQQETFLNVRGSKQLIEAIQRCWASFFNPRAIFYRARNNFSNTENYIGVVIQRMINSSKSGVMFTINPINNNREEIIIEAVYGLGESVGYGYVNPDLYVVSKNDLGTKEKKIFKQEWRLAKDNIRGVVKKDVDSGFVNMQKLSDDLIKNVAELGKRIEYYYGKAQDIEFCVEDNKVFVLQSRPVTVSGIKEDIKIKNGEVLVSGVGVSPGVVSGRIKLVNNSDDFSRISKGDILVSDFADPDLVTLMEKISGIIIKEGGLTSDICIVSRELRMPCIIGVKNFMRLNDNDVITLDANNGNVYKGNLLEEEKVSGFVKEMVPKVETITKVKAHANIREEAEKAYVNGADGIGVLRGEVLIEGIGIHPGKLIYQDKEKLVDGLINGIINVASYFEGKPVWYKTFDIRTDLYRALDGGDIEALEDNPICGWRGIRRDLDQEELLRAQFESIKFVHDKGYNNVGVLLPLVTHIEQIRKAKDILREIGLEPQDEIDFGVMIDTPASVQIIEEICREGIDFVCFGTNDLSQFTLGIDKENEKVKGLFDEMNPAVLRQIVNVIKVCKRYNVETNLCGDAASRIDMAEFVVKAGIDAISPKPEAVNYIRGVVARVEKKILLDVARKDFEI